jgi:phosphoketolase
MVTEFIPPHMSPGPLAAEELRKMDAYWHAALYLCVGMIYLLDNPLLREPLRIEHVKNRLPCQGTGMRLCLGGARKREHGSGLPAAHGPG